MSIVRAKIGNIFAVDIGERRRKFFQFVVKDISMLHSDVIRVFTTKYGCDENVSLTDIVKGSVEFHAHTFVGLGLKLGCWSKIGHVREIGNIRDILFRCSHDYGTPSIKVSTRWYVWYVNEPHIEVGRLEGQNKFADLGPVIPPQHIVERMRIGKYTFVHPHYEVLN